MLGESNKITTHTDASMKMKISLMLLKGDSSDELKSHHREANRPKHICVIHPVSGASSDLM